MQTKYVRTGLGRWTKMILAFFMGAFLVTACSKKDGPAPLVIAFDKANYEIPLSGEVVINITASRAVTENITVPVVLSGDAVKDLDYTVSAEAATIVAGSASTSIKITAKENYDREKSIKVDLGGMPAGAQKGPNSSATVGISDGSVIIYSFASQSSNMTETAEVTLELKTISGTYTAEKEMKIPIEVIGNSTAVEGTHFTFDGAKEVVIPVGKSKGSVKLKYVKQEAGKDAIELKLGAVNSHFVAGNYEKTKVVIFGPMFNKLAGTWKYKAFSNLTWVKNNLSFMDDPEALPKNNTANDKLIFTEKGLAVDMQGDLKRYFRESVMANKGEIQEVLQENGLPAQKVQMLVVKALANVSFSAAQPNVREAEIGFRVMKEGGVDILEVTIRDYEPIDFLANYYDFFKNDPAPKMASSPLRFHFEKVNP